MQYFQMKMQCRAVAAVVVGNPDSIEGLPISSKERWKDLNGRKVDLLVRGDTRKYSFVRDCFLC